MIAELISCIHVGDEIINFVPSNPINSNFKKKKKAHHHSLTKALLPQLFYSSY
jgi:hypothetical protein